MTPIDDDIVHQAIRSARKDHVGVRRSRPIPSTAPSCMKCGEMMIRELMGWECPKCGYRVID